MSDVSEVPTFFVLEPHSSAVTNVKSAVLVVLIGSECRLYVYLEDCFLMLRHSIDRLSDLFY